METAIAMLMAVLDRVVDVVLFPLDPGNRIYFAYLATSALIAWLVYRSLRRGEREHRTPDEEELARGSFIQFLFPRRVWQHPSAWLDLRYAFFHKVVSHFLLFGLGAWALAAGFGATSGTSLLEAIPQGMTGGVSDYLIAIGFMLVVMFVIDFVGWAVHYLQHKLPLLWQFHKVHHSAEVMHPISNFREHPVDNLAYGFCIGIGNGVLLGLSVRFLGYAPNMPTLLGIPLLMFLFNAVGYNLRHSHIWLRWPGRWSMIFPSPAHHHVHHSCHPDHIDKNFAFMFPIWDVIFRTYHLPEDNRDVRFGIDGDASELNSCMNLYWVPFRDAWRLVRRRGQPAGEKLPAADSAMAGQ